MYKYEEAFRLFRFAKYRFELEAGEEGLSLPPFKGSTLRGGFGHSFKSIVCTMYKMLCYDCFLKNSCPYCYIFQTTPTKSNGPMSNFVDVPRPFIIEPPLEETTYYKPSEKFNFELVLVGNAINYFPYFLVAFIELGNKGIGQGRRPYKLINVFAEDFINNEEKLIYNYDENRIIGNGLIISGEQLLNYINNILSNKFDFELSLNLISPLRIKYNKTYVSNLEFYILVGNILRRFSNLSYFHEKRPITMDYDAFIESAKNVSIKLDETKWEDIERYSSRQQTHLKIGGLVGKINYKGDIEPYLPLIALGEHIHAGKNVTFGLGKYKIDIQ